MGFTVGVNLSEATNDLRNALATARRLERLGFDAVEFAESAHDAFLPCVLAAEHTALEVHTSVAIAFPRSPMVTAMLAWDMQRYSGGRFVLGLGSQVKGHNVRRSARHGLRRPPACGNTSARSGRFGTRSRQAPPWTSWVSTTPSPS